MKTLCFSNVKTISLLMIAVFLGAGVVGCLAKDYSEPSATDVTLLAGERNLDKRDYAQAEEPASDEVSRSGLDENLVLRGRKLIRRGNVRIKVKEVDQAREKLEAMVKQVGGFVANVKYQRYTSARHIEITLRLPADEFAAFMEKVRPLGHVESEDINVTDVTDQYIDLNRRIATKEKLAERLAKLIETRSYQFKDLLAVEKELSRLQMEIEQLKGSLQGLNDRITLSTLVLVMYQDISQKVVAPDSALAPLLNAVENAGPQLKNSLQAMMTLAGVFISLLMWLLPWLIVLAILIAVTSTLVKLNRRKRK